MPWVFALSLFYWALSGVSIMGTKLAKKAIEYDLQEITGLLDEYKSSLETLNRSPKTIEWYTAILRSFFGFLKMNGLMKPVSEMGKKELKAYISYRQNAKRWPNNPYINEKNRGKLSAYSVQGDVRAIKAFWGWLYNEEYIDKNVLAKFSLPKVPQLTIKTLTEEQTKIILNAIGYGSSQEVKYRCIVLLLLDTGLRISELVSIKNDDLDLIHGSITVLGKGQKQHYVPIHALMRKELTKYIKYYRQGLCSEESLYLFPSSNGERVSTSSVRQYMRRLCMRKELDGIKLYPHLFRHTFATQSIAKGANVFTVKEIMGHKRLQTTMKYTHLTIEDLKVAHNKFSPVQNLLKKK